MTPITPKALSERTFAKVLRGYNPAEVDGYINRVIENYSVLYRENIELAKHLTELMARLEAVSDEEAVVRQSLQAAKRAGDKIIEEAYVKADDILAAIKKSCDAILRSFTEKVEAQKAAQAEINQSVLTFKNELFEKYRLHIELLEQLSPSYEYEEPTTEEYVEHIVADLKKEVAAQYGISLDTLPIPKGSQPPETHAPARTAEPTPEPQPVKETVPSPDTPKTNREERHTPKKRKPRSAPSVMELLDEYEDKDAIAKSKKEAPKTRRFMLDIDGQNENAELILSGK